VGIEPKGGAPEPQPSFNPMFERIALNGGQANPLNLVAYGLYKQAKREWAKKFWETHKRHPNKDDLDHYIMTWTQTQIDNVNTQARTIMASFAASAVDDERPKILGEALKGSLPKAIMASMLASFFYTILLIVMAVILAKSGVDIIGIFKNVAE